MSRTRHRDGTVWETVAGYSRAVRVGGRIAVSGTTASTPDGHALHPGDVGAQTAVAIDKGIAAIEALGGQRTDVVRSRVFLVAGTDWEAAARAHAERLGDVAPANTMLYISALIGPDHLVEVELDAEVDPSHDAGDAA